MSSSTSFFKKLAARAKAHHESVNAAYETYYSGGFSPRSSTRRSSSAASVRQNSTSSTSSTSSRLDKTWKKIKEHNESMNGAFASYYNSGRRSQEMWSSPSSASEEVENEPLVGKKEGLGKKMKNMVKEHHRSVNAAYKTYYGA